MAAPVVIIAAGNAILQFIKKHPWFLPLVIGIITLPLALGFILIGGAATGVPTVVVAIGMNSCTEEEDKNFFEEVGENIKNTTETTVDVITGDKTVVEVAEDLVAKELFGNNVDCTNGELDKVVSGDWTSPMPPGIQLGTLFVIYCPDGCSQHSGIDYLAPDGTPVYAAADGIVNFAQNEGSHGCSWSYAKLGSQVGIDHGAGISTYYGHLKYNTLKVKKGDKVKAGQLIGLSGNTGFSCPQGRGWHLHFEVRDNNKFIDPVKWYKSIGVPIAE